MSLISSQISHTQVFLVPKLSSLIKLTHQMDAVINRIYQERYNSGLYDGVPEAKRLVGIYLNTPAAKKENIINRIFYPPFLIQRLKAFIRNPPANPIFQEDPLVISLYQGLLNFYQAYYVNRTSSYMSFEREQITYVWLVESFIGVTDKRYRSPFTEEESRQYFQLLCYWNRLLFRELLPFTGIGGDFGIEIALAIPYLDEINRLGFYTRESSQLHYDPRYEYQTPYLSGELPGTMIPYLMEIPYLSFYSWGEDLPIEWSHIRINNNLATGYVSIYRLEVDPDQYAKLVLAGRDPFFEDIILALRKYWTDQQELSEL